MAWEKLKHIFRRKEDRAPQSSAISWVEAADSPWGVRMLDVRPVTQTMLSTSSDPQCAANAVSFGQDDGTGFIGKEPPVTRSVAANLRFPIDRLLAEGVLFFPREMEQKWALFYHRREIICVRSWLRQVQAIARVEEYQDDVDVTGGLGKHGADNGDAALMALMLAAVL